MYIIHFVRPKLKRHRTFCQMALQKVFEGLFLKCKLGFYNNQLSDYMQNQPARKYCIIRFYDTNNYTECKCRKFSVF